MAAGDLLQYGFARAERPRDAIHPAAGHREKRVNHAHLGHQRFHWAQALGVGPDGHLDGPFLHHGHGHFFAALPFQLGHHVRDGVGTRRRGIHHFPFSCQPERHHDAVLEDAFRHGAESIARLHFIAAARLGGIVPLGFAVQRLQVGAALQEKPALLRQLRQRILETVVHLRQQAGAQLHRQQVAAELHGIAHLQPGGVLKHLQFRVGAADADDLGLQHDVARARVAHFALRHRLVKLHRDQVAVDSYNFTHVFAHLRPPSLFETCRAALGRILLQGRNQLFQPFSAGLVSHGRPSCRQHDFDAERQHRRQPVGIRAG